MSDEGPLENVADNVSIELRSDGDGACNAAIVMALQLATLLLLQRCCSYNAAGATRCGTAAATLLLQRTLQRIAVLLVPRQVAAVLLQRWRCGTASCCSDGGAAATLLLQRVAAVVLQRCCCRVLQRCCNVIVATR
jgi:preprotein translocase subunit SecG